MTPRQRFAVSRQSQWRHAWLLLVPLSAVAVIGWLRPGMPTSPRGENVPQIAYLWLLRRLWTTGDALGGWNPLILGGEPTVTARLYHLHASLAGLSLWLNVPPETMFKGVQLISNGLGALGCYHLSRKLDNSPPASLVAGVTFLFLPVRVMLTAESLFAAMATASAPWLLCGYEGTRLPGPAPKREAVIWGMLMAASIVCGPQRFLVMVAPVAAFVVCRELCQPVLPAPHRRGLAQRSIRFATLGGIAIAVAAGLALFFLLPSLVESNQLWTSRYVQAYPRTSRWSVSPALVGRLLWERWSPTFAPYAWDRIAIFPNLTYYMGGALCLLDLLGLADITRWRITVPLATILLCSLCLAFGPQIPGNPAYALVRRLPLLADTVRNAFRYLVPAGIALSALAACGLDRLLRSSHSPAARAAIVCCAVALIVLDFWPITQACGVVENYFTEDTIAIHQCLNTLPGDERVWVPFTLDRPGQHYGDTSYGTRYSDRVTINDDEYHSPSAPYRASLLYRDALRGQVEADPPLDAAAETILDLSATRYMILPLEPSIYRETLVALAARPGWALLEESPTVGLLENTDALPLAHAYAQGVQIPEIYDEDITGTLTLLASHNLALVERIGGENDDAQASTIKVLAPDALAELEPIARPSVSLAMARPHATEIWIRYEADVPFLLSLSETWYPHWRVTLDDERQPLLRLNGNYLGVHIPQAGEGTVVFRYRQPWYVWLGRLISLACLGVCVWVLVRPRPIRLRHDV